MMPDGSPPHTVKQVIDAFAKAQPEPLFVQYHLTPRAEYHGNFTATYPFVHEGWRYAVQAHVHEYGPKQPGQPQVLGKCWVSKMFDPGKGQPTPAFVQYQIPPFDMNVQGTLQPGENWTDHPAARDNFYNDVANSYPTQVS